MNDEMQYERLVRQEELILDVTEELSCALKTLGLRKSELASRLGVSKGFITQVLAGGKNLTLRTLSDFAGALGLRPRMKLCSESEWVGAGADERGRFVVRPPSGRILYHRTKWDASTNTVNAPVDRVA